MGGIQAAVDESFRHHEAMLTLATTSGCLACHFVKTNPDPRIVPLAPSFTAVAERYQGVPEAAAYLSTMILKGTQGSDKQWGEVNMEYMPPNVGLAPEKARQLADWVLTLR